MMSKLEYLRVLESILKVRLTKKEVDEIMRDYAEYFVEGARQGKSDYEIAYNLGDPREVANQIIAEMLGARGEGYAGEAATKPPKVPSWKRVGNAAESAASGMGKLGGCLVKFLMLAAGICLLPVLIGGLLMLLTGVAAVILGLFGWVAAMGGCILAAIAMLVATFVCIGSLPGVAVLTLTLISVGIVAGGVLGICLGLLVIQGIWKGTLWCCGRLYCWLTHKPYPAAGNKQKAGRTAAAPQGWDTPAQEPTAPPEDGYIPTQEPIISPEWEEVVQENPLPQEEREDTAQPGDMWAPLLLPEEIPGEAADEKERKEEDGHA